ncbi:28S ribosomal protein S26, mitochondrial [Myotis brandtii]|uniref:Small ribosomal subunit protein mS26 n=1 Tax=Myotis brandtii TaxID=109478 RepID=S7PWU2_MYOBR|nr:28S ribosomal protein S26, mitochondrial [Myotis brandtii]
MLDIQMSERRKGQVESHYRGPRNPSKQGHHGSKTGAKFCTTFRMSARTQQTTSGSLQEEDAKTFITRENLDARIEAALDSPKSYNWAITKEGQVVRPQNKGN